MRSKIFSIGLLAAVCWLQAGGKKQASGHAANDQVELTASIYADKDALRELLGSDLDGHFIIINVQLVPKYGTLTAHKDDFLLRSDRDGEKTTPFAPSQIAGRSSLIISQTGGRGVMADSAGPVWGGYPGSGERPRRLGGDGGVIGNAGESTNQATIKTGAKDKDNPLLQVLKEKALPENEAAASVSGLLYFPMERQKPRNLELIYTSPSGKLSVHFR